MLVELSSVEEIKIIKTFKPLVFTYITYLYISFSTFKNVLSIRVMFIKMEG